MKQKQKRLSEVEGSEFPLRSAAWALAFRHVDGVIRAYGGAVSGIDHTAFCAEVWAIFSLARAVLIAKCRVHLFIDNKAVVDIATAVLRNGGEGLLPTALCLYWAWVAKAVKEGWITLVEWVPSHGKKPQWSATDPEHTQHARDVNDFADKCATSFAADLHGTRDITIYEARVKRAVEFTEHHLTRLYISAKAFARYHDDTSLDADDFGSISSDW